MTKNNPDLTTISLGAGLQSSVLVEMVVEGDLPPVDVAIFADTGDEPQYVYDQVDYLRGRLDSVGIPLDTVQQSDMVDDLYKQGRFAALPLFIVQEKEISGFGAKSTVQKIGRGKRQCTHEYKITPIEKHLRQLLLRRGLAHQQTQGLYVNKEALVESWLGITLDEVERMKPCRTWFINFRWPLIDMRMTRQDCVRWLQERNLPVPEKSSCKRCPYHDNAYWRSMRDRYPDDWMEMIRFDKDLRDGTLRLTATSKGELFLHRECIPLSEVNIETQKGQTSFSFCDEGYCWT